MASIFNPFYAGETFDPFLSLVNRCPVLATPTDWKETPECHVFVADLPGLRKDQVHVEVVDDGAGKVLQISGERAGAGEEDAGDTWRRVERCRGKFRRRFRLPENVEDDEVTAGMENGVLTVTVPKREVKKPETKVVEIETV